MMATIYTTVQGDTFDSIAFDLFADHGRMWDLMEANWPLVDTLVFGSGTQMIIPDIPDTVPNTLPFWRR